MLSGAEAALLSVAVEVKSEAPSANVPVVTFPSLTESVLVESNGELPSNKSTILCGAAVPFNANEFPSLEELSAGELNASAFVNVAFIRFSHDEFYFRAMRSMRKIANALRQGHKIGSRIEKAV